MLVSQQNLKYIQISTIQFISPLYCSLVNLHASPTAQNLSVLFIEIGGIPI